MGTGNSREEISVRVRGCMKEKGVTAYRVAKDTGIDPANVTRWVRGMATPTIGHLKKLAEYFGVPFEYLALGKE